MSPLDRRFRDIQIVIITNFVVVSSVGIKRVDYKLFDSYIYRRFYIFYESFYQLTDSCVLKVFQSL